MANPILEALSKNNPLISQFNAFKAQMSGKDPEAMVKELINTGKISPKQLEELKQMAEKLQNVLK